MTWEALNKLAGMLHPLKAGFRNWVSILSLVLNHYGVINNTQSERCSGKCQVSSRNSPRAGVMLQLFCSLGRYNHLGSLWALGNPWSSWNDVCYVVWREPSGKRIRTSDLSTLQEPPLDDAYTQHLLQVFPNGSGEASVSASALPDPCP